MTSQRRQSLDQKGDGEKTHLVDSSSNLFPLRLLLRQRRLLACARNLLKGGLLDRRGRGLVRLRLRHHVIEVRLAETQYSVEKLPGALVTLLGVLEVHAAVKDARLPADEGSDLLDLP